jgi:uncharacterized protein (DUF433 family)
MNHALLPESPVGEAKMGDCDSRKNIANRNRSDYAGGPMLLEDHIAIKPDVRSGKACIKGTRITVYDVLEYLAGGMTAEEVLADFPVLKPDDIRACLAFAAARERHSASFPA